MTLLRFRQAVPSKRGRIPPVPGVLTPSFPAVLYREANSEFAASVELPPEAIDQIMHKQGGRLILPAGADLPSGPIVSRFLAKVAMEAMAARLVNHPKGLEYLVDELQLDPLRNHARRGDIQEWPFHSRRIYDANAKWINGKGTEVQIVHEFDILATGWSEWFFVLALFGLELVINYGGPDIDGYKRWLSENGEVSPLYSGKNSGDWPVRPFSRPKTD